MVRSTVARLVVAVAACQLLSTSWAQSTLVTVSPTPTSIGSSSTRSSASAASSASSEPQVHIIKAGAGGFKFTPQALNASVGDTVTFEFYPLDHSVVQAEFESACVPYSYVDQAHAGKGFWTETQWVNTTANITHYNITINDTQPIFFYCAAPESCTKQHMVGAINPNATQTLELQIKAAENADFQLSVGDPVPGEASSTLLNGPTSTGTSSSSASSASSTNTSAPAASTGTHLSAGAIAGIVVGAVAFLIICAALFFYMGRLKSLKDVLNKQDHHQQQHHGQHASTPATNADMGYAGYSPNAPGWTSPAPAYGQHGWEGSPGWVSPGQERGQGHLSMQSQMSSGGYKYQQGPVEMGEAGGEGRVELDGQREKGR